MDILISFQKKITWTPVNTILPSLGFLVPESSIASFIKKKKKKRPKLRFQNLYNDAKIWNQYVLKEEEKEKYLLATRMVTWTYLCFQPFTVKGSF